MYCFFNESAKSISHMVTLKAAGRSVKVWDRSTSAVTVKLDLQPFETKLLTVQ